MNPKIKQILEDLYFLEPNLKANEEKIIKIIEKMIEVKPIINIDTEFKNNLKKELQKNIEITKSPKRNFVKDFMRWFILFLSGAVLASMIMFIVFPSNFGSIIKPIQETNKNKQIVINNTEDFAIQWWTVEMSVLNEKGEKIDSSWNVLSWSSDSDFQIATDTGITISLSDKNKQEPEKKNKTNSSSKKIALLEISNSNAPFSKINFENSYWWWANESRWLMKDAPTPTVENMTKTSESKLLQDSAMFDSVINSETTPKKYKYVFSWEKLNIEKTKMPVYKKEKTNFETSELLWFIQNNKNILPLSLDKLENGEIKNITISENIDFWLQAYLDFENSSISFQKNYSKWPNVNEKTKTVLSDKEILSITNDFILKYNISLQSFSSPIIESSGFWDIRIIYPLKINWKKVYSDNYEPTGIIISIDEANKKVSNVSWIEKLKLSSNEYDIEADFNKIIKNAEDGWINWKDEIGNGTKDTILHLINPQVIYVKFVNYKNNQTLEYFTPCILFETKEKPVDWEYFTTKIIVPLIKE